MWVEGVQEGSEGSIKLNKRHGCGESPMGVPPRASICLSSPVPAQALLCLSLSPSLTLLLPALTSQFLGLLLAFPEALSV